MIKLIYSRNNIVYDHCVFKSKKFLEYWLNVLGNDITIVSIIVG